MLHVQGQAVRQTRRAGWYHPAMSRRYFRLLGQITGTEACSSKIVLTPLQVASHMSIHAWQTNFELSRTRDKEDIVQYLGDIRNQQELMQVAQMKQAEDLNQIMKLMQRVTSTHC